MYIFKCSLVTADYSLPHWQNIWSDIFYIEISWQRRNLYLKANWDLCLLPNIKYWYTLIRRIFPLTIYLIGENSLCSLAFTFSINNCTVPIWNVFDNCVITHLIYPIVKPRVWLNINNCLVLLVSLVGKQPCNLR